MYLEHFKFKELPFTLTPNVSFFCQLRGHQEALNTLLFSLRSGEGFIKIIGEVGCGKTLLCRKLLESLGPEFMVAYIPNPDLNPNDLRKAFARELGLDPTQTSDQHELLNRINTRLVELNSCGKQVVLLIDEAQALSIDSLEAIRLFTNLETESKKLLHIVLFGQPELDDKIKLPALRQLKQRISFSYYLPALTREDVDTYIFHRLTTAGYSYGTLFSKKARDMLFKASAGIPRLINILSHKALLVAYGKGENKISPQIIRLAIEDTESICMYSKKTVTKITLTILAFITGIFVWYLYKGII